MLLCVFITPTAYALWKYVLSFVFLSDSKMWVLNMKTMAIIIILCQRKLPETGTQARTTQDEMNKGSAHTMSQFWLKERERERRSEGIISDSHNCSTIVILFLFLSLSEWDIPNMQWQYKRRRRNRNDKRNNLSFLFVDFLCFPHVCLCAANVRNDSSSQQCVLPLISESNEPNER